MTLNFLGAELYLSSLVVEETAQALKRRPEEIVDLVRSRFTPSIVRHGEDGRYQAAITKRLVLAFRARKRGEGYVGVLLVDGKAPMDFLF